MKFFFYGIFLARHNREAYGIFGEPEYATVKDYATYGVDIVTAYHQADAGLALTGITVDVPLSSIKTLDALEYGYTRQTITTVQGVTAQMYTGS